MYGEVSDTVFWHNGRCYSCGCADQRRNVRTAWCKGCGKEVGGWGRGPEEARQPAAWRYDDGPAVQPQHGGKEGDGA